MPTPKSNPNFKKTINSVLNSDGVQEFKVNLNAFEASIQNLPAAVQQQRTLELKQAIDTAQKVGSIKITPKMQVALNILLSSNLRDEISDEEAFKRSGRDKKTSDLKPKVPTITTLPAVIHRELSAAGRVTPEWHQVKKLPGYLSSSIRAIGRQVFKPFTDVPIEDIQVIANVNDSGPNTQRELNAVAGYLVQHGERKTEAELHFHDILPQYHVDLKIYSASGFEFMVVKDFAGVYIYSYISKEPMKQLSNSNTSRVISPIRVRKY
jgi:hypothetical protein